MAGDWIKMEHVLAEKPEVAALSSLLSIDRFSVVGRLHRVWSWFDQHTEAGCAPGVTTSFLDSLVALDGFASALEKVGWLSARNGAMELPKFDRHNSKSAKDRALARERMKRSRCAPTVTKPPLEKRREEKKKIPPTPFCKPPLDEVRAYCQERGNGIDAQEFLDHYDAIGWVYGKSAKPVKDWKACIRTWEATRRKEATANGRKSFDPAEREL